MSDYLTAYYARMVRNQEELIKLINEVKEKDPSIEAYVHADYYRDGRCISSVKFIKDETINGIGFHEVPYHWSGCGFREHGGIMNPGGNNYCMPFTADDVISTFVPIKGGRLSQVETFRDKAHYLKWCSYLTLYIPKEDEKTLHS